MADQPAVIVRETSDADQEFILRVMTEHWGSDKIVTRGRVHVPAKLPGLIAEIDGEPVGLITYDIYGRECELITMNGDWIGAAGQAR